MAFDGSRRLRRVGLDLHRPGRVNRVAVRRARRELPQGLVDWLVASTEPPIVAAEVRRRVTPDLLRSQLREVPEVAAAAFVLLHYDGLSIGDVATALAVPADVARSRVAEVEQRVRFTALAGVLDPAARRPGEMGG